MTIQYPPYYHPRDRLDNLAARLEGVTSDNAIWSIILANPNWRGEPYLPDAVIPTGNEIVEQQPENLRSDAAALRAMLDTGSTQQPPKPHITGQTKSDLSGIATPQDAVFWSAQMRVLLIRGSRWGYPEEGTDVIELALSRVPSPENLQELEGIANAAMDADSDWYDSTADASNPRPTLVRLLATLSILPESLR